MFPTSNDSHTFVAGANSTPKTVTMPTWLIILGCSLGFLLLAFAFQQTSQCVVRRRRARRQVEEEAKHFSLCQWLAEAFFPTSGGELRVRSNEDPENVSNWSHWGMRSRHFFRRPSHRPREFAVVQSVEWVKSDKSLSFAHTRPRESPVVMAMPDAEESSRSCESTDSTRHLGYVAQLRREASGRRAPRRGRVSPVAPDSPDLENGQPCDCDQQPGLLRRVGRAVKRVFRRKTIPTQMSEKDADDTILSPPKTQNIIRRLLSHQPSDESTKTTLQEDAANFYSSKLVTQPEIDRALNGTYTLPSPDISAPAQTHHKRAESKAVEPKRTSPRATLLDQFDEQELYGSMNVYPVPIEGLDGQHRLSHPLPSSVLEAHVSPVVSLVSTPTAPQLPLVRRLSKFPAEPWPHTLNPNNTSQLKPRPRPSVPAMDTRTPTFRTASSVSPVTSPSFYPNPISPVTPPSTTGSSKYSLSTRVRPDPSGQPVLTHTSPPLPQSAVFVTPTSGATSTIRSFETATEFWERTGELADRPYDWKSGQRYNYYRKEWEEAEEAEEQFRGFDGVGLGVSMEDDAV